ncbi:MAG TPA: 3'-5' exoribonuclease [Bacteroidetes bacterium]|nr:3'-5' exoribonuclease [Bacteroidota bacterium]HEX04752.1 3'-5' exoribonuclease [Bacteroidota bacterium]
MSDYFADRVTSSDQPQNNMELMIDVESFGTVVGAPVVTIGAVLFDPYKCDSSQLMVDRSLSIRIDISDSIKYSLMGDNPADAGKTLRWWFEQSDAAIKALVGDDAISMQEALIKLSRYCHERGTFVNDEFFPGLSDLPRTSRYWAKDPDFDMRLMQHFYDHSDLRGAKQPWDFWSCRSVRTIQDLAWPEGGIERPSFQVPGVAHDARWDAIQQAMTVQAAMVRLGLSLDQYVEYGKYIPPTA